MLAAAIRASLIEAGEPDTSVAAQPTTSQHGCDSSPTPNKQHHQQQQQQALPQAFPFQTSQPEQQSQQQQQQTQQEHQHQLRFQEKDLPNRHGLPPEHDSAAEQFRDSTAVMQETGSAGMVGQGSSQQGSRQASNALPGGQLRTAWSSDAVVGRGNLAGSSEDASEPAGNTAEMKWYRTQRSCWEAHSGSGVSKEGCYMFVSCQCLMACSKSFIHWPFHPSSLCLALLQCIHNVVALVLHAACKACW